MKKEDFIYLIYKEYKKSISEDELDQLNYWLSASVDNQKIKTDILLSMDMLDDYEPTFEVDVDSDFSVLQEKMDGATKTAGSAAASTPSRSVKDGKVIPIKRWIIGVAAILLGVVAFTNLWYSANDTMLIASADDGQTEEVVLSDGSIVWLNENSTLTYPKSFAKTDRLVTLIGEAYFEVAKDANRPFQITTTKSRTTVLGTSFNIKEKADGVQTEITVKTGKVKFEILSGAEAVTLSAYDAAILHHNDSQISKSRVKTFNKIAWQSKQLSFRDSPLIDVIEFLEEYFEVEINAADAEIENCTIDMSKQPADLKVILNNIKRINNVEVEKSDDKKYKIVGGDC